MYVCMHVCMCVCVYVWVCVCVCVCVYRRSSTTWTTMCVHVTSESRSSANFWIDYRLEASRPTPMPRLTSRGH